MLDFNISVGDVCKKLKQLKDDKSLEPSGIHSMFLKKMAEIIVLPLKLIFNRSMLSNKLMLDWKSANVSPIFKKGSKSELGNYMPVYLTAIPCKIMESIIRDKMLKFAQENNFMTNDHQHGFMKSRYCLTNVLETLED